MYKSSGLPQGVALKMKHINDNSLLTIYKAPEKDTRHKRPLSTYHQGERDHSKSWESATHFGEIEVLRLNLKTLRKLAESRKEIDEKTKRKQVRELLSFLHACHQSTPEFCIITVVISALMRHPPASCIPCSALISLKPQCKRCTWHWEGF